MKTFNEILIKNRNDNELKSRYQKLIDDSVIENSAEEYKNQFLQPDVSGNEANPKENKKDGEVAVAFAKWINQNQYEPLMMGRKWSSNGGITAYSTQDLYEGFKRAKATDR